MLQLAALFASTIVAQVTGHYVFPNTTIGGVTSGNWVNVRTTNNWQDLNPLTDVTIPDMACYDSAENGSASTASIAAGASLTFNVWGNPPSMYHPSVLNVYMAQAPNGDVTGWTPTNAAFFKVYEITAVTDGGTTITWPAQYLSTFSFTIPEQLPSGQYLVRVENIALHVASSYGGAQFYIACAQIAVTGGGTGTPGPLVAFPGAYTGYEPGILIDIYYPIPANYTQPGPAVWPPAGGSSPPPPPPSSTPPATSTKPVTSTTPPVTSKPATTTKPATSSAPTTTATGGTVALYGQCGGTGYTGATVCVAGATCVEESAYYSQCQP